MYNLYLLNKIYLKKNIINNNYNFKICNKFYHKLFFKFCIKLLINYKIIQLAKIIIFIFLNRYEKLVFLEDCNKIISFCFLQKKQNKYSFMEKNDIMLGNIFCHEKFRKKKLLMKCVILFYLII